MNNCKFRGKTAAGKWVYGYYWKDTDFGIDYIRSDWGSQDTPVLPETVGQFIGRKDKKGNELYDGDIIGLFCNTQIREIKYCSDRLGYFIDIIPSAGTEEGTECLGNVLESAEKLGNIHDNPELLEDNNAK